MAEQQLCQHCDQQTDCQSVYHQLGTSDGPSVVIKVLVAFLLPIVVFIGTFLVFEKTVFKAIESEIFGTTVNFLAASIVTLAVIMIVRKFKKNN